MTGERPRRTRGRWLLPAALAAAALVAVVAAGVLPQTGAADDGEQVEGGWLPALPASLPLARELGETRVFAHPDPSQVGQAVAGEPRAGADTPADADAGDVPPPTAVRIPAIGVHENLVELGLHDDGAMEVPDFGDAGWYERGPRPGEDGGAVIAAHYDSTSGPDVFYDLAELQPGDEVEVEMADGRAGVWRVADEEQTPKDELPAERIWPDDADEPQLALITCGGVFDDATGHYTDNHIVYAEWIGWRGG